jgi:hypothetical protein
MEDYEKRWWKNFTENFWRPKSTVGADTDPKPKKASSKKEAVNEKAGFVYLLKSSNGYHKIGKAKRVNDRLSSWKRFFPVRIDLVCYLACHDRAMVENLLHKKFWKKRVEGEWYKLDKDDVAWIKGLKDYELG